MQSIITLRNMFEYPQWPAVILFAAIIAIPIVYLNIWGKKKKTAPEPVVNRKPITPPITTSYIQQLKDNYLNKINDIKSNYETGSITRRECFQHMSICVRQFVSEATNRDITTYTLTDIKKLKKKPLEKLIESYYEPEFGVDKTEGVDTARETKSVFEAIENTKMVISQWK